MICSAVGARNGGLAGQTFVQHAAERVEIGASVRDLAADYLRRNVRSRTAQSAGDLERLAPDGTSGPRHQTEVHQHGTALKTQKDVGRFEIAMNDARSVNEGKRSAEPSEERQRFSESPSRGRNGTGGEMLRSPQRGAIPEGREKLPIAVRKRLPLQEIHRIPRVSAREIVIDDLDHAG